MVRTIYPWTFFRTQETLFFQKVSTSFILFADKKLLNKSAVFDFESICGKFNSLVDTKTTAWVGKREPTSVCVISNLLVVPTFVSDTDSLVSASRKLCSQRLDMSLKFHDFATTIEWNFERVMPTSNKRRSVEYNDRTVPTHFLPLKGTKYLNSKN